MKNLEKMVEEIEPSQQIMNQDKCYDCGVGHEHFLIFARQVSKATLKYCVPKKICDCGCHFKNGCLCLDKKEVIDHINLKAKDWMGK